jgi:hypothetical protein
MQKERSASEELAFKAAELDAAMNEAGFRLAREDPDAARDFSYRARYIRSKSTYHPTLQAYLEYYGAVRAYSIKISTTDDAAPQTYHLIVKNHAGSLKELLAEYFLAVRKGIPLLVDTLPKK